MENEGSQGFGGALASLSSFGRTERHANGVTVRGTYAELDAQITAAFGLTLDALLTFAPLWVGALAKDAVDGERAAMLARLLELLRARAPISHETVFGDPASGVVIRFVITNDAPPVECCDDLRAEAERRGGDPSPERIAEIERDDKPRRGTAAQRARGESNARRAKAPKKRAR